MGQTRTARRRSNESLGGWVSSEPIFNGVHLHGQNGWMLLEFWTEDTLRIRVGRPDEAVDSFSYALVEEAKPSDVPVAYEEQGDLIFLRTNAATVEITRSPLRIRLIDSSGNVLNEDDPGLGVSWLGQEVTVYKRLQPGERFLGLGEKTGPLDKRGRSYVNWNTDNFGYGPDSDPLYASIPFFVGVHEQGCYGFFLNNSFKTTFNFGASSDRFAWYSADDGQMDYFLIAGGKKGISGILQSYAALTGTMPMPPKWSLGFQQCRYSYYPDSEVLRIAATFREKGIPCDVLYLDIHYMDEYKVFTWNPSTFSDPAGLVRKLKEMGIQLVVIMDPGIKVEEGYSSHDSGIAEGHFVALSDGEPYRGQVWPGWSYFPDFTDPGTRAWWGNQMKSYTDVGIEGFWNDMNEPAAWGQHLPNAIEFSMEGNGTTFKEARNIYGMQMARATLQGGEALLGTDKRVFNLTRAGFAGIQRFAAVWTGDNTASPEHMMAGVRLVNSLGLSGVAFAGYDIGGFVGEPSPALFARWMQLGAFTPLFRAHSMINSRDAEPWSFGEEVEDIARNFIRLRYRMMPYLYTAFFHATSGVPIQNALAIHWPDDPKVYQAPYDNEYMFGPDVLVVPVEARKHLTKCYLPSGNWYDFYDDRRYEGGGEHILEVSIEQLPLFIRAGAVIPMQSAVLHTGASHDGVLQLHVYPGNVEMPFSIYEDDGTRDPLKQGCYALRTGTHVGAERRLVINAQTGVHSSAFTKARVFIHGGLVQQVAVNGLSAKLSTEDFKFVEPVSRFDPFMPPVGDAPSVSNLTFVEMDWNASTTYVISY